MKVTTQEMSAVAAVPVAPRFDMYTGIHKALRALMADSLLALGRMDAADPQELSQTCQRVLELLEFCRGHLSHENRFIHSAMEARAVGSSETIGHEHADHEREITRLEELVCGLLRGESAGRAAAAAVLYQQMALFVADNFQHMQVEETVHNAVLWERYTDAELVAIHDVLVASIPSAEMMYTLRWLVPSMNPYERTALLADMRTHVPASAFAAALETVRPHLTDAEWSKLAASLELRESPGPGAGLTAFRRPLRPAPVDVAPPA